MLALRVKRAVARGAKLAGSDEQSGRPFKGIRRLRPAPHRPQHVAHLSPYHVVVRPEASGGAVVGECVREPSFPRRATTRVELSCHGAAVRCRRARSRRWRRTGHGMIRPGARRSRTRRGIRPPRATLRNSRGRGTRNHGAVCRRSGVRFRARRFRSQSDLRTVAARGRRRPGFGRRRCRGSDSGRLRGRLDAGVSRFVPGPGIADARGRIRRGGRALTGRRGRSGRDLGNGRLACAGPGLLRLLAGRLGGRPGRRRRFRLDRVRRREDPDRERPQDQARGEKLDTGESSHRVVVLRPARSPAFMIARSATIHATASRPDRPFSCLATCREARVRRTVASPVARESFSRYRAIGRRVQGGK